MTFPYEKYLPECPDEDVMGTAQEVILRLAKRTGLMATIVNVGLMSAGWNDALDEVSATPAGSRSDYHRSDALLQQWPKGIKTVPFIGTAMRPLSSPEMVVAMAREGVLSRVHRYFADSSDYRRIQAEYRRDHPDFKDHLIKARSKTAWVALNIQKSVEHYKLLVRRLTEALGPGRARAMMPIMSVAPTSGGMQHVVELAEAGCTRFDIDTMGGLEKTKAFTRALRRRYPDTFIISGSIDNPLDAKWHAQFCDAIDLGVGNGKSCSTRPTLGIGAQQGWVIAKTAEVLDEAELLWRNHGKGAVIIASGGNIQRRDRAMAIALGADAATFGSSTQTCAETDAETVYRYVGDSLWERGVHWVAFNVFGRKASRVLHVRVVGMASPAVAGKYSTEGKETLPEGEDYLVPVPGGRRRTFKSLAAKSFKALGGTLSSIGAPVDEHCLEWLRRSPLSFVRSFGSDLENGTPGAELLARAATKRRD